MQNRCVNKIEKSFAVFSIDRVSPERFCLLLSSCLHTPILTQMLTSVTLPPPPDSHSLNTRFKLNNFGGPRQPICLSSCAVSNRTSRRRQSLLDRCLHSHLNKTADFGKSIYSRATQSPSCVDFNFIKSYGTVNL